MSPSFLKQALRFDGIWWRNLAWLGAVHGPEWWTRYSPPAFAAAIFALVRSNREGAIANMQRVLGRDDPAAARRMAFRMFVQFSHCLTETMGYYGARPCSLRLDAGGRDPLADVLTRGHGAIVVTGHFGNWDIAAKALSDYGVPVKLVMAREANASAHEFVEKARERVDVNVILSDSSVFSSLNMIAALRRNEIVALQLDRMVSPAGARAVPFFGVPALFPSGPFVLARLSGAPVIPIFLPRVGRFHYQIRTAGPFHLSRDSRDPEVLARAMQDVVRSFEDVVREFPTQWFQFQPFWPEASVDRPDSGDASPPMDEPSSMRMRSRT